MPRTTTHLGPHALPAGVHRSLCALVIQPHPATAYASVNRTCELGMTRATGRPYRHLLEVLDEVTRPLRG